MAIQTLISTKNIHDLQINSTPGLHFRNYRGTTDIPAIVALNNRVYQADQSGEVETVEQLAHHFQHLKNCDPYEDILLGEIDGQIVVYSRVWWEEEADGTLLYRLFGNIHPDWRRIGLGTALLPYNEARLQKMAQANHHSMDVASFFESWCGNTTPGNRALLEENGYKAVRYFYEMSRAIDDPLPLAPMPSGLEVRSFQKSHNRLIWEAITEAFRDHWGYIESTETDYHRFTHDPTRTPELWQVAWDGDQVAGMILNIYFEEENKTFNRKRGWTDPICVRRAWRRRGLARALLVRSIQMFREMGFEDTALGVDTENPNGALKLYESVGYQIEKTWMSYRKPFKQDF